MKILLIGPQGSGKSTQADLLAEFLNLPKIALGDIFRKLSQEDSPEGQRIRNIVGQGHLVDDQTAAEVVKKRLSEEDCQNGFVMDGYPRTVEQQQIFDPGFDKVIYLDVPEEEVIKRLLNRGRADDTYELIKRRLDLYYKQTAALLDHYRKSGKLVEIKGLGDIEKVQDEIKKSI
ncbi:nucleoside monophosphate kinase [Candidatus Daviesbacteria bacterium]|nr:nucleoside monophosphate kinase [Candidatus Daviesbacteria bacterium]